MNHRHDELPPLSPVQQAEALRLAARLQEEASATQSFLAAAEEAGIERRFLDEAIRRLEAPRAVRPLPRPESFWIALIAVAGVLALYFNYPQAAPPLLALSAVLLLVSFLFALPACSLGRSRAKTTRLVFGGWVAFDLVFMGYFLYQGAWGNFAWPGFFGGLGTALALQGLGALAGAELARQAYGFQARLEGRRPQSL